MNTLSYQTLQEQGYSGYLLKDAPERVLQFGEGNFLRAFVDHFIDVANESVGFNGKVVVVQPIRNEAMRSRFVQQDGLFTLYQRGIEHGEQVDRKRVISCISRCLCAEDDFASVLACAENPDLRYIVSNTTEAGIVFCETDQFEHAASAAFPGKLTRFLFERFERFGGSNESGFVLLPCELIDNNGLALKTCVMKYIDLWKLSPDFAFWVESANEFCSTLVDRIVPGYPQNAAALNEENGYVDNLLDSCEPFGFWAIEGRESLNDELPFVKIGLPVLLTPNCTPYKQRKVRILNGAHTASVCAALLCGLETVGEMMDDAPLRTYIDSAIQNEIIPTLDLPRTELDEFAASVIERFLNPFIRHELMSITLNSTSKWCARVLPSVREYRVRTGKLPPLLIFSFAAYASFLQSGNFPAKDDAEVLEFFAAHKTAGNAVLMRALCAQESFWGANLTAIEGFLFAVITELDAITNLGARAALEAVLRKAAAQ